MKEAQSLIEYVLILVLISLIAIATLNFMGKNMSLKDEIKSRNDQENITKTMQDYCKIRGLVYNEKTEKCETHKVNK